MTLTLLLDLDDTLLGNDADATIPIYLRALGAHLAAHGAPEALAQGVMTGTGAMIANRDPRVTLEEAFDASFYPLAGLNKADLQRDLATFYAEVYPTLREGISPRPVAQALINDALVAGHTLAITTNPLFPRSAIDTRITFAELPAALDDFALITTFEDFHFSKPHPAYLAEALGRLGWPEGGVVVVGNDPERDIVPAMALGLASFYISDTPFDGEVPAGLAHAHGDLDGLLAWAAGLGEDALLPRIDGPAGIGAMLRATPAVLDGWLRVGAWAGDWMAPPAPGEWSVSEILCHLRDVEREVHLPRVLRLLSEDAPFIEGVDTDGWATVRDYASQDGPAALAAFTAARVELLTIVDGLSETDWARMAQHSMFGPTSLQELLRINTRHDRLHIRQVKETMDVAGNP